MLLEWNKYTSQDVLHCSQSAKVNLSKIIATCYAAEKLLTKLVHGSCFGYFQALMVVLLLYRDNGGHLQLICNIHQLTIQRRELLLKTEIQPPVKLPREEKKKKERQRKRKRMRI